MLDFKFNMHCDPMELQLTDSEGVPFLSAGLAGLNASCEIWSDTSVVGHVTIGAAHIRDVSNELSHFKQIVETQGGESSFEVCFVMLEFL